MAMGRPPKPTALKVVQGNPGKRPLNKKEPKSKRALPPAPEYLSTECQDQWRNMAKMLFDSGVLLQQDCPAFEMMMDCYEEIIKCRELIKIDGRTYHTQDKNGNLMIKGNPAVSQLRAADRQFKNYLVEFGMTPSSRSRIVVDNPPEQDEEDPLAEFFG